MLMVQAHCCEKYSLNGKAAVFDIVFVSSTLTIFEMKINNCNNVMSIKNSYLSKRSAVEIKKCNDRNLLKSLFEQGFISGFLVENNAGKKLRNSLSSKKETLKGKNKNSVKIFLNYDKFLCPSINSLRFVAKNWKKKISNKTGFKIDIN